MSYLWFLLVIPAFFIPAILVKTLFMFWGIGDGTDGAITGAVISLVGGPFSSGIAAAYIDEIRRKDR